MRIDTSHSVAMNNPNTENKFNGTLIYDCVNSSPRGFVFAVGQQISLGTDTYTVVSVTPLYDGNRLHHYEVGFI